MHNFVANANVKQKYNPNNKVQVISGEIKVSST